MCIKQAIYIENYGGLEALQFGELPCPVPKPDQVLIEVHAAAVNPRDWLLREGRYVFRHLMRGFPLILGSDPSSLRLRQLLEQEGFVRDKVNLKVYQWRGPGREDEPWQAELSLVVQ